MNARMTTIAAALGALLCTQAGVADVVEMKNGDRITGKLTAMAGDKLTISTSYGDLALQWSEVAKLTTDQPADIMLQSVAVLPWS